MLARRTRDEFEKPKKPGFQADSRIVIAKRTALVFPVVPGIRMEAWLLWLFEQVFIQISVCGTNAAASWVLLGFLCKILIKT